MVLKLWTVTRGMLQCFLFLLHPHINSSVMNLFTKSVSKVIVLVLFQHVQMIHMKLHVKCKLRQWDCFGHSFVTVSQIRRK